MTGGIRGPGLGGSGGDRMTSGTSGVSIMPGHYFVFRYTVNLYNGGRSSSADPVPAYESGARVLDDRLELAAAGLDHGPGPGIVLVGPALDTDPRKAATQLSAYDAAGTERVILAPSGTSWQHDYEFAGNLPAGL